MFALRSLVAVASLLLLAVGAYAGEAITPREVEGAYTWGGTGNVTRLKHLYFSGQPDAAALERAKAEGVEAVVNLRTGEEMEKLGFDERAAVEALGLDYLHVPVAGDQPFSREDFERIEDFIADHPGRPVLVHCASSNRAGAWLATHLAGPHGMSVGDSIDVARRVGLVSVPLEVRVRAYSAEAPEQTPAP